MDVSSSLGLITGPTSKYQHKNSDINSSIANYYDDTAKSVKKTANTNDPTNIKNQVSRMYNNSYENSPKFRLLQHNEQGQFAIEQYISNSELGLLSSKATTNLAGISVYA